MGCSSPVTVSKQVPSLSPQQQCQLAGGQWVNGQCIAASPPSVGGVPAAPGEPYAVINWLMPSNPAYYGYLLNCTVLVREVDPAYNVTNYKGFSSIGGQQQPPVDIPVSAIPNQIGYMPGIVYWRFNLPPFKAYQQVQIWAQACNAAGCSQNSPVLTINSAQPGGYGTPPVSAPASAPGQAGPVHAISASPSNFVVAWSPVSGADTYVLKDMTYNPPDGYNLMITSGTQAQIPQSLLESLFPGGIQSGYNILLAVQACNIMGCGPIGPSTVIPFSV